KSSQILVILLHPADHKKEQGHICRDARPCVCAGKNNKKSRRVKRGHPDLLVRDRQNHKITKRKRATKSPNHEKKWPQNHEGTKHDFVVYLGSGPQSLLTQGRAAVQTGRTSHSLAESRSFRHPRATKPRRHKKTPQFVKLTR